MHVNAKKINAKNERLNIESNKKLKNADFSVRILEKHKNKINLLKLWRIKIKGRNPFKVIFLNSSEVINLIRMRINI